MCFIVERYFFFLEYREAHFPGLFCLKQKDGKIDNLRPKLWTNPYEKILIFRRFELLVFIA